MPFLTTTVIDRRHCWVVVGSGWLSKQWWGGEQRRGHLIRRRGQLTRASDQAPGKRKVSILNFSAAVERR